MDDAGRIIGWKPAVHVIHELMTRPESAGVRQSLDRPVLVFEGARGNGKTALLTMLVELVDQNAPHAHVDLEADSRPTSVPDVLSVLASGLGRRCPRYPELLFPRFIIGRLVIRGAVDLDDHSRARQQVTELLTKKRAFDVQETLQQTADGLLPVVQRQADVPVEVLGPAIRHLSRSAFDRLRNWRPVQRVVLGSHYKWYGSRGRGLTKDAIDVLVDLNRWGRNPTDADNRQRIEELLWDAFLADLCAGFHGSKQELGCVALLDNVDTEIGARFLHGLVRARCQRAAEGTLGPDPLTVLATSRGLVLADLPAAAVVELPLGADGSSERDRKQNGAEYWWARYRLADLTEAETAGMVSALALRDGNNERLTRMVHELTGGHPASTRLVLDTLAERPEHRDDLATLLNQPEPGGRPDRLRVEHRMLRWLGVGFSSDVFEDLVTCAAARNRSDAERLAKDSGLVDSGASGYEVIEEMLWPITGGAGPALLRRLLLRQLSHRSAGPLPDWDKVFGWLRDECKKTRDKTGELYYALAVRDLAFVTDGLRDLLDLNVPRWGWPALTEIASAPRRHPAEVSAPIDQMRALLRDAVPLGQPLEPLSRLIASLWIVGDPLTDSRRAGLHRQLDADLRDVAKSSSGDADPLLCAAGEHRKQISWWK